MQNFSESTPELQLGDYGSYAACAIGESMRPMLRGGRDMIVVEPLKEKVKKYDVILFKDESSRYVLHRVVKIKKDAVITRGDNTYFTETVAPEAILGILTKYNKNGKSHSVNDLSYKLYSRLRVFFYPLRKLYVKLRRALALFVRKIFKKRK